MTPSLLGNIVLGMRILGIKIINSDVLSGLCCGFMATLSVTPSYLFLVRDRVLEDELEQKVSATTGFMMGQFTLLLSIFCAPLYLALGKPHTITALALPYLFVHLVIWNNEREILDIDFSDPEYAHISKRLVYTPRRYFYIPTRKRIRNFSTQCLFVKHLIFPLFNQTFLPSSTLVRLVHTNLFRCNNKIIFFSSSFWGWVISFIFLMQGVRSVSDWIEPVNLMRWHRALLLDKKLPKKIKPYISNAIFFTLDVVNYPKRIFNISLYFICLLYFGKMPFLIPFCKKTKVTEIQRLSKEIITVERATQYRKRKVKKRVYDPNVYIVEDEPETKEEIRRKEIRKKEEKNLKLEITAARRKAKAEKKGFSLYFISDEVEKEKEKGENSLFFWFDFVEKLPVLLLFNCQEWNKPFRYIRRPYLKKTIFGSILKRDGMSQFFLGTGKSDGKQRISFSYPPSLLTFWEMIEKKLEKKEKQKNKKITRNQKNKKITRNQKNKKITRNQKNKKPSLYKNKFSIQKKKKTTEQKTFLHRICALNKGFFFSDILEKKNGLQTDQEKKTHVLQQHDPLISGPFRTRSTVTVWEKSDIILGHLISTSLWKNTDTSLSQVTRLKTNRILDFLDFTRNLVFVNDNRHLISKSKCITEAKQLKKKVPEWTTLLITELEINFSTKPLPWKVDEAHIRSRLFKILLISSYIDRLTNKEKGVVKKTTYIFYPDFSKDIIFDTRRTERKRPITGLYIPKPRSPLFWGKSGGRLESICRTLFFQLFEIRYLKMSDFKSKMSDLKSKTGKKINYLKSKINDLQLKIRNFKLSDLKKLLFDNNKEKKNRKVEKNERLREDRVRLETKEAWDELSYGPQIRSCLLIIQCVFRKHILFPLMIIAKNMTYSLLYKVSDFNADFKELAKEKHVLCTNSGTQLSDDQVIETFLEEGFSIRIRDPFSLNPWCKSKLQDSKKKKRKKVQKNFYFLTVFGMEADEIFGSPRTRSWDSFPLIPFLKPVLKKLKRKITKKTKEVLLVLILKIREKYFSDGNSTGLGNLEILSKSRKIKDQLLKKSESIDLKLTTDLKIKKLSDRTNETINEKKRIEKKKFKKISEIKKKKIPPDFPDFNHFLNVKLESQLPKNSWKRLKRRTIRLIKKLYYSIKIFIAKKYIDIFLPIINIFVINTKHFVQLIIRKYISKRKEIPNQKKNQSQNEITEKDGDFFFISTIKKSKPIKKDSHIFYDLSCMSQGYVFLKLSQLEVLNLDKLRSVLEYQGTSFFIKPTIKNSFRILNSQLRDKKLPGYDQWKNWLRGHCQYNSPIEWSRLIPQKWRTQVNHHWPAKNKDLKKWGLKEKDFLFSFDYKNKTSYQVDSHDAKLRKCYRFSRLLDVCLNSEMKEESAIYEVPSLNKNNRLSKETDSHIKNSRVHFISRPKNLEPRPKKLDIKYSFFSKPYVNDNESDPSNSDGEIYFDWLNIEKEKDKLKKVFQKKVVVNLIFWLFSEVTFLSKEYFYSQYFDSLRQNFGFYTVSVSLERDKENIKDNRKDKIKDNRKDNIKDNRSEAETEFEILKKTILDQRIKKTIESEITESQTESEITESPTESEITESEITESEITESQTEKKITESQIKKKKTESKIQKEAKKKTERQIKNKLKFRKHLFQKVWYNADVEDRLEDRLKPFNNLSEYKKEPKRAFNAIIINLEGKKLEPEFISVSRKKLRDANMYNLRVVLEPIRTVRKMSKREAHIKFLINLLPYKRPAGTKIYSDFPIPENILSSRTSRKLKILTSLKFKTRKVVDRNPVVFKQTKKQNSGSFLRDQVDRNQEIFKKRIKKQNRGSVLQKGKHRNRHQNELIKLKSFLWPNYRLEDLACMNRYWFDTNNASRLSMLRLYMYPSRFQNVKCKTVPLIDLLCSLLENIKCKIVPRIDLLCSLLFYSSQI
uniref:Ycf1 n=1 Tax=Valerianella locusta TaxID=59166 RepID=UPI0021ACD78B|nr:Ycf1 [Valerianella locusta]UUL71555.1 Ycf1 [Valerianella locusta]